MSSQTSKHKILGNKCPHNFIHTHDGDTTHGDKAITLAKRLGSTPLEWQELVVREMMKTVPGTDTWCHPTSIMIVPRQNGKSEIAILLVLYRLFVLGENILFTAHQWTTAQELGTRLWEDFIEPSKDLNKLVAYRKTYGGRHVIKLKNGGKIEFRTRSKRMGRGLTKVDLIIFDEAMSLPTSVIPTLQPAQRTVENSQVIYLSSAANMNHDFDGLQLSMMRQKALDQSEDDVKILLMEWMAPDDMPRDKEETWAYSNPSYGYFISASTFEKEIASMSTPDGKIAFDVEILGRGVWASAEEDGGDPIIDIDRWVSCQRDSVEKTGDCSIAVDVSPDSSRVSIVSATRTSEGVYLSISPQTDYLIDKTTDQIIRATDLNDPVAILYDPKTPASILTARLVEEDIEPVTVDHIKITQSLELFLKLFEEGKVTHDGDPRFVEALASSRFREIKSSGGRALTKTARGDITPIVASTFAIWGLVNFSIPESSRISDGSRYVGSAQGIARKQTKKNYSYNF